MLIEQIGELGNLIEKYEQFEEKSDIQFTAPKDPLKYVKLGVSEKISQSGQADPTESAREAEELVDSVSREINKPDTKKHICNILRILSEDLNDISIGVISGVVATLVTGGAIVLPSFPAIPGIAIAASCYVLSRGGIALYCSETK